MPALMIPQKGCLVLHCDVILQKGFFGGLLKKPHIDEILKDILFN